MKNPIPKKRLGQHWLHDSQILNQIVSAAEVRSGDTVLEIGPGLGTLTEKLLHKGAKVFAVEFDHSLAEKLKNRNWGTLPAGATIEVIESDILQFDLTTLPEGYKVVANIPYYLTSNLIRTLCESRRAFSTAAILIQKEVAERVVAEPGQISLLAVSAQFYCEVALDVIVPAELFTPPPKVDSQVLVLNRRTKPLFQDIEDKAFFRLVRAGFSQKRKTLLNSLSASLQTSKSDTQNLLEQAQISPKARAQALSLEQWHALYMAYDRLGVS